MAARSAGRTADDPAPPKATAGLPISPPRSQRSGASSKSKPPPDDDDAIADMEDEPDPEQADLPFGSDLLVSRKHREFWLAKKERLKFEQASGLLLPATEVRQQGFAMGRMHASARESLPSALAPQLVGLTDLTEIERIIRDGLRAADARVAKELDSRYGSTARMDAAEEAA